MKKLKKVTTVLLCFACLMFVFPLVYGQDGPDAPPSGVDEDPPAAPIKIVIPFLFVTGAVIVYRCMVCQKKFDDLD